MDGFKRPFTPQPQLPVEPRLPVRPVPTVAPTPRPTLAPVQPVTTPPRVEQKPIKPPAHETPLIAAHIKQNANPTSPKKRFSPLKIISGVLLLVVVCGMAYMWWYNEQLKPVNSADKSIQKVEIKDGSTFSYITNRLKERGLIRNTLAFDMYAQLSGKRSAVKAGTCKLSPSESSIQILDKLASGCHDFVSVTFYPGATIHKSLYKPDNMNITQVLLDAGYSQSDITAALAKTYSGPLFADKPVGTDLEGYIYGETYYVDIADTVEQVLQRSFDQMYSDINKNVLIPKFKQQGLNLYQAITLASIVQREMSCSTGSDQCYKDQQQIAKVFMDRLKIDMPLGSDPTFYYAADKLGVQPTINIDSSYNTRVKAGLPPGPIASPGIHALMAVANPAGGDYLFFVSGDDGKTYFSRTQAEHEANVAAFCHELCKAL